MHRDKVDRNAMRRKIQISLREQNSVVLVEIA